MMRATLAVCVCGCIDTIGGAFEPTVADALAPEVAALVDSAFDGLGGPLMDHHAHVAGIGTGDTGAYVHRKMLGPWNLLWRFKYAVYLSAAGVRDLAHADQEYIARLLSLWRGMRGAKLQLLAFDKHYQKDGSVDDAKTNFYVPNDYVFALARAHPEAFIPVMSVHPYRRDALQELETWHTQGGRMVKWLPNAMGMDPSDPTLGPYYETMHRLGLVLLSHAGDEQAVDAHDDQGLGNPLRLRAALDAGVRVIVAHCAVLGDGEDLDRQDRRQTPNFELFVRLLDEPRYRGLVYGEISALTAYNRAHGLLWFLRHPEHHDRLLFGSDYPIPAINAVIWLSRFVDAGALTETEAETLKVLYRQNPLLFDFVMKRTVRGPDGARLPASIFTRSLANLETPEAPRADRTHPVLRSPPGD